MAEKADNENSNLEVSGLNPKGSIILLMRGPFFVFFLFKSNELGEDS